MHHLDIKPCNILFNYVNKDTSYDAIGEYNMKVVDGSKYSYGFDLATQYKGFSSQFEYHYMVGQPQNINHSLLNGYDTDFFTMNGFAGEFTYFFRKKIQLFHLDMNNLI